MVLTSFIRDLTIFLLTWNVKDGEPIESLSNIINVTEEKPDIYAFGFQEIKFNIISYFTKEPWVSHLESILKDFKYVQIKTIRLLGMLLVLFVKKEYLPLVKNIRTSYTRTGFGGFLGNKGGVAISFEINGTSIVLINAHFHPYVEKYDKRIEDYKAISQLEFYKTKTTKLSDHDYIFWMGDFNFRLDNLTNEYITIKIATSLENNEEAGKIWDELFLYDQLNKSISLNEAFEGYKESKIDFQPTYKFKPNTSEYDPQRKPAWCDRILYKVNDKSDDNGKHLELKTFHYTSHNDYKQSDHKPVSSMISIKLVKSKSLYDTILSFQPVGQWNTRTRAKVYYIVKNEAGDAIMRNKRSIEETEDRTDTNIIEEDLFPNEDWIGLYPADFTSLSDFVDLVFANLSYPVTMATEAIDYNSGDFSDTRRYEVDFPDIIEKKPGEYRLLYINKYSEVLSMSNVFVIED